jgi:hypothetical protein
MRPTSLDSSAEIEKIAREVLKGSKGLGVFPTPVDKIVSFAELTVAQDLDLGTIEPGFIPRRFEFAKAALRKVLGLIDFRIKTIYLDQSQIESRKNFIKLHETGHDVLVWQKDVLGRTDDEVTIAPEVKDTFEAEASYFASCILFQLERFEEEAAKYPLSLKSARALAQKFGGSIQASVRRYVQTSRKRCAVLVLRQPEVGVMPFRVAIRNIFESPSFMKEFGVIVWPEECGLTFPFVLDIKNGRRMHEDGVVNVETQQGEPLTLAYHFFSNSYTYFVFLFPPGEHIRSRMTILER